MVTKVLNIDVKDSELDELESKLGGVNTEMRKVEGESQKASKGLKKVGDNGGAIATLDSLTGGLATRVRDAAEATKVFNISLKGTRTALLATGIGALVVALGLVVAYWDDIVNFITQADEKLQEQIDILERRAELLDAEVSILDKQLALMELQGEESEEIRKKKIEILRQQLAINGAELANLEVQRERLTNQALEVSLLERIKAGLSGSAAVPLIDEEESARIKETTDRINELRGSILDAQLELERTLNPKSDKEGQGVRGPDQEGSQVLPTTGVTLSELETLGQMEFDALKLQQTARTNLEDAQSEHRKWIAEQEARAKIESYMLAADGFASASQLIGQETAAGKGFAVASTLVSTYLSAQRAYESQISIPTPDAPFRAAAAAGVAITAGLENVKQILSTKIPGANGSVSVGGGGASRPPAFNVVDSSPENQLNQALLERNNEPTEAFVVDKKVTSKQELRRQRQSASSFG